MFALLAVKHSPFFLYRCNIIIMKSKKLYTKLLLAGGLLLFSGSLTSCNDFLTLLPTDQLPEENFWQDKADLDGVRAGAYDQLANATQTGKILQWGELRSDNLTLNTVSNTSIDNLQNAILQPNNNMFDWAGFYTGINYCNLVIEKGADMTVPGKEVDPSFTRAEYNSYRAEMFALRSLYYFYLVRSYRDVPYVTSSVRTDAEAMKSRIAVSSGVAILGECIDSVETNLKYATENFGSDAENRGRFTKNGMRALLADMYLWRACMLKDYVSKDGAGRVNLSDVAATDADGNVTGLYTTKDGEAITDAYCNTLAKTCLEKAKKYADDAIKYIKVKYDEELEKNTGIVTDDQRTQPYPLYLNNREMTAIADMSYAYNFGAQNSLEGILELQYDGTSTTNGTVNSYFSTYSSNQFNPGTMTLSNDLISGAQSVDPTVGFGKTDLRLLETCYYPSSATSKPICKFVISTFDVSNSEDLTETPSYSSLSARTSSANNAHWPIYRLTDVMLIKAEAIARLGIMNGSISLDDLKEGYRLINQIFKRNNPALVSPADATGTKREYGSDRLKGTGVHQGEDYCVGDNGAANKTASDLLSNVYRERQREFVGEGKRWFDIVRQAEYSYVSNKKSNSSALGFGSFKSTVANRLSKLYSLYNPIYSEELKVNGKGQADGGMLEQNPIWDRYTKK